MTQWTIADDPHPNHLTKKKKSVTKKQMNKCIASIWVRAIQGFRIQDTRFLEKPATL